MQQPSAALNSAHCALTEREITCAPHQRRDRSVCFDEVVPPLVGSIFRKYVHYTCGIAESMTCGSVALKKKNQNDMELQRREDEVCVAILDRELGRGRSKEGAGCQSRV